jgi:putative FmdB family regulatory protein
MPIYEYKCLGCDDHFEKRQSVSEDALTVCEKCGGKLEKQVSLSGFQFKGAGWYVTDYAGKKPSASESTKSSTGESTQKAESASKTSDDASAKPKTDPASKGD